MDGQEAMPNVTRRQTLASVTKRSTPISNADALITQHEQIAEEQRLARRDRYTLAKAVVGRVVGNP
jgi:hypothetical protein